MPLSEIDNELTFKRIALFSLEDNTKEGYGSLINSSIKNNFTDTMQFEIVMPGEALKYPVSKREAVKIGRKINAAQGEAELQAPHQQTHIMG